MEEDVQNLPKMRLSNVHTIQYMYIAEVETALTLPSLRTCIAKHDQCCLFEEGRIVNFTHSFHFLHWVEFTYF